jgi:hypothetical protein
MKLAALVALVAALPAAAAAQNKTPRDPVVQVGLFGYRADGMVGGAAYDTWPDLTSTVYVTSARCGLGAGNRTPPQDASDIWQFTGKVLSETNEEAVVQLSWRRLKIGGRAANGDESSTQLTLRNGEAQQLDQASIEPRRGCQTVAVAFEARYTPRWSGPGYPPGMGVGGITSGTPASGSGGGMSVGRAMQSVTAGGSGGSARVGAADQGTAQWDVNLWLVRAVPGKAPESYHSVLKMNESGASFTFAPVRISTNRGDMSVSVSGTLNVVRGSTGEQQLVFTTIRRIMPSANPSSDDGTQGTQGTSRVLYRMPGPDEVLAFEMPPIGGHGGEGLLAPDVFSVRLTVAPRQ